MYHKELLRWGLEESDRDMVIAMNGLTAEERRHQPTPESNHIDFIVWHVARVEDMWIQRFAQGKPFIWEDGGWAEKLGIPTNELGFGFTIEQVRELPVYVYDLMAISRISGAFSGVSTNSRLSSQVEFLHSIGQGRDLRVCGISEKAFTARRACG